MKFSKAQFKQIIAEAIVSSAEDDQERRFAIEAHHNMHKELHGVRPRGVDYDSMTIEEIEAETAELHQELIADREREDDFFAFKHPLEYDDPDAIHYDDELGHASAPGEHDPDEEYNVLPKRMGMGRKTECVSIRRLRDVINEAGKWHGLGRGPESPGVYHRHEPKKRGPSKAARATSEQRLADKWNSMDLDRQIEFLEMFWYALVDLPPDTHPSADPVEQDPGRDYSELMSIEGADGRNFRTELARWKG